MGLLAEELVQEWLNSQGFFTIRGARAGYRELDLLAVRQGPSGVELRHVEVQASPRPIGYITLKGAARRGPEELRAAVAAWVAGKFDDPKARALRERLWAGEWTRELVVHRVMDESELALIVQAGVVIHRLRDLVPAIGRDALLRTTHGNDLVELLRFADP